MVTIIDCSKKDGKGKKVVDHGEKMPGLSSVTIIPCSFKKRCEALGLDTATATEHDLNCAEQGLDPKKTTPENIAMRKKWQS